MRGDDAGDDSASDTIVGTRPDLPSLAENILSEELDPHAATMTDEEGARTMAINMRDALREARASVDRGKKKSKAAEG